MFCSMALTQMAVSTAPAPLSAAALQMFLAASGAGMGREDDSSVARMYAQMSGATLPIEPKK